MEEATFTKSIKPPTSFWTKHGKLALIAIIVVFASAFYISLIRGCELEEERDREKDQHAIAVEKLRIAEHNERFVEEQTQQRRNDRQELRSNGCQEAPGDDLFSTFNSTSEEWIEARHACQERPFDLYFAPHALGLPSRDFSPQNPDPIQNKAGTWFAPNETCRLGKGAMLRLEPTKEKGRYLLKIWYPEPDLSPDACPANAYRLVLAKNAVVSSAVLHACYKRTKFTELGVPLGMPDHALSR